MYSCNCVSELLFHVKLPPNYWYMINLRSNTITISNVSADLRLCLNTFVLSTGRNGLFQQKQ